MWVVMAILEGMGRAGAFWVSTLSISEGDSQVDRTQFIKSTHP